MLKRNDLKKLKHLRVCSLMAGPYEPWYQADQAELHHLASRAAPPFSLSISYQLLKAHLDKVVY